MAVKKPYKQPSVGDKVDIFIDNKKESGILLNSHEKSVILLKLSNGYNIGIKKDDVSKIVVIDKVKIDKDKKGKKSDDDFKLSGKKPIIDFILTGGTISSKLDSKTGGVSWLINAKELFFIYPEIFEICDIRIKSPFLKASENMNSNDWIRLSKIVSRSLNDPHVRGVIVSHGTDTLHYTSAALSFMLGKVSKPVVLTYSQRSSDRGSSDSRMNLKCSAYTALSDISEVVLVGHSTTNDDYCNILRGTKVRKMHTSRRDTFRPINISPLGKVYSNGKIEKISEYNKRINGQIKIKADSVYDDKIALIKYYPCMNPESIDYYRKKKYKAIIIEMTGLGHVATEGKYNLIPVIRGLVKAGVMIFAVPQTLYGRLNPNVYSPGRKLKEIGVVFLNDILPETALVKLGWVLGHKEWRGTIATPAKMLENVCYEFNNRLNEEFMN
ncbi:Glu-tRNA(Gln) amidotransferase subunit GatD [Candidatus Pacearchaeota archaeon]|nr:Glu-tRNA(Gln) amidotransferase subunit GatD [Candidatus Pacearchaeota archaeon]